MTRSRRSSSPKSGSAVAWASWPGDHARLRGRELLRRRPDEELLVFMADLIRGAALDTSLHAVRVSRPAPVAGRRSSTRPRSRTKARTSCCSTTSSTRVSTCPSCSTTYREHHPKSLRVCALIDKTHDRKWRSTWTGRRSRCRIRGPFHRRLRSRLQGALSGACRTSARSRRTGASTGRGQPQTCRWRTRNRELDVQDRDAVDVAAGGDLSGLVLRPDPAPRVAAQVQRVHGPGGSGPRSADVTITGNEIRGHNLTARPSHGGADGLRTSCSTRCSSARSPSTSSRTRRRPGPTS